MNIEPQPQPQRNGMRLLAAHLRSLDPDTKPARRRLEERLGGDLAHLLLFALGTRRRHRPAA